MPDTIWRIKGKAGRLRAGGRLAATLGAWEARHLGGERWQFTFTTFDPDPFWFENGETFNAILTLGEGEVRRPCEIVSRDPLIIDMEIPQS